MNGTSHLTSVLLDKGTVREALRAVVRAEMGLTFPPRQQTAYTAIQALLADGTRLYITPQLLHILHRPANLPIARTLLPELSPLIAGRYLRRWARRLREAGISREDALVVSYASFGVDEQMETFGVATVLTTDARLKAHYLSIFDQLMRRFRRMTRQLKAPYRDAHLPTLMAPEELAPLLLT